ncbi:hypothetical protein [Tardiphaga sp.]|jgi:hypothetical protein|uniref:hypothetical protein n=1 Tax=Tardiphaga sp. TaxID=1926292 RepID=UPI0037DA29EE
MTTSSQSIRNREFARAPGFETTPAVLTAEIAEFTSPHGDSELELVPVRPRAGAKEGRNAENVLRAVRDVGGSPVVGRVAWASAYVLTAAHHVVWSTPDGQLIDPTPTAGGERVIAFARDTHTEPDFDLAQAPPVRRMSIYKKRTKLERVGDIISHMPACQTKALNALAEQMGLSLQQLVMARTPDRDPLETAVNGLLSLCARMDTLITPTSEGPHCENVDILERLLKQKVRMLKRLDALAMSCGFHHVSHDAEEAA